MRVLISGGGVAGMTAAYWLHRNGHVPVVVERAPHGRLGGYGFDFHGAGYDIADRMGVVPWLERRRLPVDSIDWVDRKGRAFARLDRALLGRAIGGRYLGLMHTTLEEALTAAVSDDVEIRYGQAIDTVRQHAGSVGVTFANGTSDEFDLLVGADGIHSATRELVFGPERRFARHLGYHLASYPVRNTYGHGRVRAHHTEPGRQVVLYPTGEGDELVALFLFAAADRGRVPREARLDVLHDAFAGMGWLAPRLLGDAPPATDVFMDTLTQISMSTWHRGRVALAGDACGCLTLLSGQGVSFAMASAYLLAEALPADGDPAAALHVYQRRLHHHVTHLQRRARRSARMLVPHTSAGLAAQRLALPLMLRDRFAGLLRRRFAPPDLLADPDATARSRE